MDKVKALIGKPTVSAGVGAVAISQIAGSQEFVYNGQRYSLYTLGAVLGFGSSFVSEMAHQYIFPHIPHINKYAHLESMVFSVAVSAGTFVAGAKMLNQNLNMQEAKVFAAAGAISEAVASYVASNLLGVETI